MWNCDCQVAQELLDRFSKQRDETAFEKQVLATLLLALGLRLRTFAQRGGVPM
jgi:hypothetical protein